MKNSGRINFRLDPVTEKRLEELVGSKYGRNKSDIIRTLIDKAWKEVVKEAAKEIIGEFVKNEAGPVKQDT